MQGRLREEQAWKRGKACWKGSGLMEQPLTLPSVQWGFHGSGPDGIRHGL